MVNKREKKYRVIVKIGDNADGSARCVKYNVNDLVRFAAFLDVSWPGWRWFNVYAYQKGNPGPQLANFTNRSRPAKRHLTPLD
jgi:hypothetical protein